MRTSLTIIDFVNRWKDSQLTEKGAAQEHFRDVCALLDEPTPTQADPTGNWYAFEKGLTKTKGGQGWADVWKRGSLRWSVVG
jgi:hypothetical protein